MKRIIIPTFEKIKWMPPTITLFNTLAELGYEVVYITIYPDEYYDNFDQRYIKNISLFDKNLELLKFAKNRILSSIAFRIDEVVKRIIAHTLGKALKKILKEDDILWVVNELTVMYAGTGFLRKYKNKFIFTIYELHQAKFSTRNIKLAANLSKITVVPEYNRSHMQKCFFGMDKLPLVLPNKPGNHPLSKNMNLANDDVMKAIDVIKSSGKKIILYMGILSEERPLEPFVEAIESMKEQYAFVVMGRETDYLKKLQSKYPDIITYLGFFTPPEHLYVASHADIGLLVYVSNNDRYGLNALYCAPNKIYEYTGFGMPVITNNIPGLYYTIEINQCGYCVDMNDKTEIIDCLNKIIVNYDSLSQKSLEFYNKIDTNKIVDDIIKNFTKN